MPFGLSNTYSTFQHFINDLFSDMLDVCVVIYLDNILIYLENLDNHQKYVKEILGQLKGNRLYVSPEKREFHRDQVEFLNYILSLEGLQMDEDKVQVICEWLNLYQLKDVQSFLGFANFYRRFIHNYSELTVLLTRLTQKNIPWSWNEEYQNAFKELKVIFILALILTYWNPNTPILVETNVSNYAIVAILSTYIGKEVHPIAFHSRTLNSAELNYNVHNKGLLVIYEAFRKWRHYLEGI